MQMLEMLMSQIIEAKWIKDHPADLPLNRFWRKIW